MCWHHSWCWLNLQSLLSWNVTLSVLQLTHCDCTCWHSDALFPCCGWSCIWHGAVTAQQLMRLHKLSSINWKHLTPDWHKHVCMSDAQGRLSELMSAVQCLISVSGHVVIHHRKQPVIFLGFLSLKGLRQTEVEIFSYWLYLNLKIISFFC